MPSAGQSSAEPPRSARVVDPRLYDALFPAWSGGLTEPGAAPGPPGEMDVDADAAAIDPDALAEALPPQRDEDPLQRRCRALLAALRKLCPDIIPPGPVPPGEVTPPIDIGTERLQDLVHAAVGMEGKERRKPVIWEQAGSELLVHLERTRVAVTAGVVLIAVTVEADGIQPVEITVPFATGRSERLAGMVFATEPVPRGPAVIIDRWGEAIVAAAWQILLDVVATISARTGVDTRGTPLVPGAVVAVPGALRIVPQAQHEFEAASR